MEKNKLYSSLSFLCFNLFLASLILVVCSYFSILSLDVLVSSDIIFGTGMFLGFISLVLWEKSKGNWQFHFDHKDKKKIKVIPKQDDNLFFKVVPYLFLLMLLIIAANQFFKWEFVIAQMTRITILAITFGAITFWRNRDRVEKEIEQEKEDEEKAELRRANEFDQKFPRLSKLNLEYGFVYAGKIKSFFRRCLVYLILAFFAPFIFLIRIPYKFVKWMYKEGRGYSTALIAIVIIGFVLRIWNLGWLQGSDNFNILSARALHETGTFVHQRNIHYTYLIAWMFNLFGVSIEVTKFPFIFYGVVTIVLFYFLGKFFNKKIGVISAFLFAISPVAIEKAGLVREYSEMLLITVLALIVINSYILKARNLGSKEVIKRFLIFGTVFLLVFLFYFFIFKVSTIPFVCIVLFAYIWSQFLSLKIYRYSRNVLFIFALSPIVIFILLVSTRFFNLLSFNPMWFSMFFNPSVSFPMQWFSGVGLGVFAYLALFLMPLFYTYFFARSGKMVLPLYLTFFSVVGLFCFSFNNHLSYVPTRYLYSLYSVYVLIFGIVIYLLISMLKKSGKLRVIFFLLLIFFSVTLFFVPQNISLAANHSLDQAYLDGRQVTSLGDRNFYYNILSELNDLGLNNKTAIIVAGEQPFFVTWYFNYTINRSYMINTSDYLAVRDVGMETGDRVFFITQSNRINEVGLCMDSFDEGFFLDQFWYMRSASSVLGTDNVKLLSSIEGYKIYYWRKD
jgi:hypothetical protein